MDFPVPQLTVQGFPVHRNGYVSKSQQTRMDMIQWLKASADAEDLWLRTIIAKNLELFYVNRLEGHPAGESLPTVCETWILTIGYGMTEELDAERISLGFMYLLRKIRKWPQPMELMKVLPRRSKTAEVSKVPEAGETDEAHANGSEALENIMNMLKERA